MLNQTACRHRIHLSPQESTADMKKEIIHPNINAVAL
jgi:hypothetical protein